MLSKLSRRSKILLGILCLILFLALGAGYVWQFLGRSLPPEVEAAEDALFDGTLVGVGLVDVEKAVFLERYWLGEIDPEALPMDDLQQGLVKKLFSGPAAFKENLQQLLVTLYLNPEDKSTDRVLLAAGRVEEGALLAALEEFYILEKVGLKRWKIVGDKRLKSESPCDKQGSEPGAADDLYLQISPRWILLFNDPKHGEKLWQRLNSGQPAAQETEEWREYRSGKLLSFMALIPAESGDALGGMAGMMAKNAATENQPLNALAVGVTPLPAKGGLNLNLHLVSADRAWRQETATKINQRLEEIKQDALPFTPTLAALLASVEIEAGQEAVEIDVLLTSQVLNNFEQVVQEGISSLFGLGMSAGNGDEESAERINQNPTEYPESNPLALGAIIPGENETPPLFLKEPFAVDLKSISLTEDGLLELWMEGKVGFSVAGDPSASITGKLSFGVDSVKDASGRELLRDERCLGYKELGGRSPNREEETSSYHPRSPGWIWKHIRLAPGVTAEQIDRIAGKISFSAPVRVRRFAVPLQAGETVEHAGMRFYLGKIEKNSIVYQLSGESSRLLEVRAKNQQGEVLQQGWKMSNPANGQATQSYAGEVKSLELYVAEEYLHSESAYLLQDIFAVPGKKEAARDQWFAPKKIDPRHWQELAGLDMEHLKRDPERARWDRGNKKDMTVATGTWAPLRMLVSHEPHGWSHNPEVRLYAPVVPEFPGVLSALSYRVDEPAEEGGPEIHYEMVHYWHNPKTGDIAVEYHVDETPMNVHRFTLATSLAEDQKLGKLKGEIFFRFPTKTKSSMLDLKKLWQGETIDGVAVTLTKVSRGMFPGYGFKVEGALDKLVNLHGISSSGERVAAMPINFQSGGYWTMTLPFNKGIEKVELVTATEQKVFRYPFDFTARYQEQ